MRDTRKPSWSFFLVIFAVHEVSLQKIGNFAANSEKVYFWKNFTENPLSKFPFVLVVCFSFLISVPVLEYSITYIEKSSATSMNLIQIQ